MSEKTRKRIEAWRAAHERLMTRRRSFMFSVWVTGIAGGIEALIGCLCVVAELYHLAFISLAAALGLALYAFCTKDQLRPTFDPRRWRVNSAGTSFAFASAAVAFFAFYVNF